VTLAAVVVFAMISPMTEWSSCWPELALFQAGPIETLADRRTR
jgi:hypothetical protein